MTPIIGTYLMLMGIGISVVASIYKQAPTLLVGVIFVGVGAYLVQ